MKYLVVIRHGYYDSSTGNLNDFGRDQIESLSEKIKARINGESILILSSIAQRAVDSAEILSKNFEVDFEKHEILWSQNSHPEDIPGTLELIKSRKDEAEVLILVTHYEYVEELPTHFCHEELGVDIRSHLIDKGEAWFIDCEKPSMDLIV